jgi:ribosomal-protein-alanine N-acetyltransferase
LSDPARRIRTAGGEDVAELSTLERALFGSERAASTLRHTDPSARVWVARGADGVLEGFVSARLPVDELEIVDVGVRPDRRRRGVARALLEEVLVAARRSGAVRVVLEVGDENGAARALYAGLGFTPCGRRPGYYRGGAEDGWILERVLS